MQGRATSVALANVTPTHYEDMKTCREEIGEEHYKEKEKGRLNASG